MGKVGSKLLTRWREIIQNASVLSPLGESRGRLPPATGEHSQPGEGMVLSQALQTLGSCFWHEKIALCTYINVL